MFEVEYLIFCRSVQINETGIDLLGTLDTIYSIKFPAVYNIPLVAVTKLRIKKSLIGNDLKQKIEIEHNNQVVFRHEIVLPGRPVPKGEVIYLHDDLLNVRLDEAGNYYVNLYIDDRKIVTRLFRALPATEKVEHHEDNIIQL